MRTTKMLCLLSLLTLQLALTPRAHATAYTIHVDSQSHQKFGLFYPGTYKFHIPAGQARLSAQYRYDTNAAWSTLPEKARDDVFNGIDAVRFDYPGETAYVSVRFSRTSDYIFLRVVDASGQEVAIRFDSIPRYYDDRRGAVTITLDDWSAWDDVDFVTASNYLGAKGLYFSAGVVTQDVPWSSVQQIIDRYGAQIEIASHSTYHSTSAEEYSTRGYNAEVIGSRDAIRNNLSFGAHPYVPLYIEPGGYSDPTLESWLTTGDYLVARDTSDWFPFGSTFVSWDTLLERYGRSSVVFETYGLTDSDIITIRGNALFDQAMAAGGIYHLMDHPWLGFWHENSYLLQHLDYIRGKTGVWYVPCGQLYEYHFLQEMRGGLTVQEKPLPSFSATPTSGIAPLTVAFTDTSSWTGTSWLWDFGDGTTSTTPNPSHTYTAAGSYNVTLTVTGSQGSSTKTQPAYIVVSPSTLAAGFSASPVSGSAPLSVTFTDTSTGNVTDWLWDFGDGTTSTQRNPVHLYQSAGSYTVTLTVTGPAGSSTASGSIVVQPPPPVADFSASPLSGNAPLSVIFTDTSSGSISGWLWEFGDGTTSTERNPVHTYSAAGTYTVKLSVSGPGGSNAVTRSGYITVQWAPPVANFSATPLSGSTPLAVTFTDTSSGNVTAWRWDFGDGATSTQRNPVHRYTKAGSYTVKLTATGYAGSSTKTRSNYIVTWRNH